MFKFDLSSGYHHLNICFQQQTFLGFQWNDEFYCFTVLPFGLCSSGYIFTKVLRPLVRFWRENGTNLILYLDDGLGITSNDRCAHDAHFVKDTLTKAGFIINEEKSIFKPCKIIEWLGLVWNSDDFSISVSDKRIQSTKEAILNVLENFPRVSARQLAQITGRIVSLLPVVGNVARLMTKFSLIEIEKRISWDAFLRFSYKEFVLTVTFLVRAYFSLECQEVRRL